MNDKFSDSKSKKGKNAAAKKKGRRLADGDVEAEAKAEVEKAGASDGLEVVAGGRRLGEPACHGQVSRIVDNLQIRPPKKPNPAAEAFVATAEKLLMAAEIAGAKAAEQEGLVGSKYLEFMDEATAEAKDKLEEYKKKMGYIFSVDICVFFCIIEIGGHIDGYLRLDVDLTVNLCMPRQDITITIMPKFSIVVDASLHAAIFPIAKGELRAGGTLIGVGVEPTMFIDMKNDFSISGDDASSHQTASQSAAAAHRRRRCCIMFSTCLLAA